MLVQVEGLHTTMDKKLSIPRIDVLLWPHQEGIPCLVPLNTVCVVLLPSSSLERGGLYRYRTILPLVK
jgi:hypothetical protein